MHAHPAGLPILLGQAFGPGLVDLEAPGRGQVLMEAPALKGYRSSLPPGTPPAFSIRLRPNPRAIKTGARS